MYVYVPPACLIPAETLRGHQIPWNWSYKWLCATLWMLGMEFWSSGKAGSTLKSKAISPGVSRGRLLNVHFYSVFIP